MNLILYSKIVVLLFTLSNNHSSTTKGIYLEMKNNYYVYIMANKSKTIYTGVTNDLVRRVYEHKNKFVEGFTKKYKIKYLVYYEIADDAYSAITREKQIKGLLRQKKIALIEAINPQWRDLSDEILH